jgi:sugar/nucleoside kinase (ribokinase family)
VKAQLLVVGAATRDIDRRDARGWRLGGTVSYAALAAARLGVAVRALIGADEQASHAAELDTLRAAGVDILIAPLAHGPVFENREMNGVRRQAVHGVPDAMSPAALPREWRDSGAVLLGPVAGELRDEWATALAPEAVVALAWQGLLRHTVAGEPVTGRALRVTPIVARADVLFVSAEDVAAGGPPLDDLLGERQQLFMTHGDKGGLRIRAHRAARHATYFAPRPKRTALDTTGAGDVFAAGYMAARLQAPELVGTNEEWRHWAIAAALASLNVTVRRLEDVPGTRELCAALLTPRP